MRPFGAARRPCEDAPHGRPPIHATRAKYDWRACAIAIVVGLAAAVPAALLVAPTADSTLLLTAVVTIVGTVATRWVYARAFRPGARQLEPDLS